MGLVSRTPYVDGEIIDPDQANTNEQDHLDEFNGNIDSANLKASAGVKGTQLADAPLGVPTGKINDKAVTGAKIANDISVDANRAVDTDHIKNNAVKKRTVKVSTYTWTPGGSLNGHIGIDTGLLKADCQVIGTYITRNGGPPSGYGALNFTVWWNTANDHLYLTLWCPSLINISEESFCMDYIPAT